jgi:hypothetical protein
MRKLTKKEVKKLFKAGLGLPDPLTPEYFVNEKIVSLSEWEDCIEHFYIDEYKANPMLQYHMLFQTPFYKKINKFLKSKHCKGFAFNLPDTDYDLDYWDAAHKNIRAQIWPFIHSVTLD